MIASTGMRTRGELFHAVRSVCRHLKVNEVVIVGSQTALLWQGTGIVMSKEIDLYPLVDDGTLEIEASEEIFTLFGEGSDFHDQFGFYIDGVDASTSVLPADWRQRAIKEKIWDELDQKHYLAIAPGPNDMIVAKLARSEERDVEFVRGAVRTKQFNEKVTRRLLRETLKEPQFLERALFHLDRILAV